MTDAIRRRKARRRREALARLAALPDGHLADAGRRIARRLLESPAWGRARTVHTYVSSLPGEVDTRALIEAARTRDMRVLVPVVSGLGEPLRHAAIDGLAELSPGPLGLLQPASPRFVEPAADLVLVPGVLFDRRGFRLGRGGGFYDRFLAGLAGGFRIGLIYDEFLVDEVPVEDHDVPVDSVATPSGLHPGREPP